MNPHLTGGLENLAEISLSSRGLRGDVWMHNYQQHESEVVLIITIKTLAMQLMRSLR